MRLNASIPALLALAALFLLPATLLAKTTHRRTHAAASARTVARKTAAHKTHRKSSTEERVHASRHRSGRATVARVSARHTSGRHLHRAGKAISRRERAEELAADSAPQTTPQTTSRSASREATSDDFLKAASASDAVKEPAVPRAEAHAETREPIRRSRRSRRTAKPLPVVSHERETPERHDLQTAAAIPAATPVALYNRRGRLIIPPPLRGSHEILIRQNEVADRDGLDRIQNDEALLNMRDKGLLVALPTNATLDVDERLPGNRRYCRPWTAHFLANLARAHYDRFHTPLQVNSAVRTVDFQEHLIHINGNAAPAEGDTASPHLTGQAVDLAKHGLSRTEVAWMRGYLLPLVQQGKIDVEEEFKQSCFHISVYKNYLPPNSTPRRSIASARGSEAALATALR